MNCKKCNDFGVYALTSRKFPFDSDKITGTEICICDCDVGREITDLQNNLGKLCELRWELNQLKKHI